MRLPSLFSEAWRNIAAGTSKVLLFSLLAATGSGLLAVADTRSQVDALTAAAQFRNAGASVRMLQAPAAVDGARCEALAGLSGVTASGALRHTDAVTIHALPATPVTRFEASPGLIDVLALGTSSRASGVWLSEQLAAALGAAVGDTIATASGDSTVAGVYRYPSDGRDQLLSYAVLEPVPAAGLFDQCWTETWPSSGSVAGLLRLPVDPTQSAGLGEDAVVKQLNPRLGESFDLDRELRTRATASGVWVALALGALLGAVSVRFRRLELASARHAGVDSLSQSGQIIVETAAWALPAFVLTAPVVLATASLGNPGEPIGVFVDSLRIPLAASGAALMGALIAVLLTRERHLFRYFKDR